MKNNNLTEFLLSFFPNDDLTYAEEPVNDFWLVRQIHGVTGKVIVSVYTEESFKKYKEFRDARTLF